MIQQEWLVALAVGGFFILLGIVALIWDKKEEQAYYNAILGKRDVREFLHHWPWRPELGAIKVGGRISIALGLVLMISSGVVILFR